MGMSTLTFRTFALDVPKLFPLTISRGTSGTTRNMFVEVSDGKHVGIGEGAPPTGTPPDLAERLDIVLAELFEMAQSASIEEVWQAGFERNIDPVALAALDCALWDLKAKQAGKPLFELLGAPLPSSATTVTIGIEPIEVVLERVPKILSISGGKALKVKLGSPAGRDHDRGIWEAAREAAQPFGVVMRADANGGWTAEETLAMAEWLSERGCEYIEQPIERGKEVELEKVFGRCALPIYLDETIRTEREVVEFVGLCDGVNLKLMKSGGVSGGLGVIRAAKEAGKGTMIGCMCETAVGIAQSAALSGWCDFVDLDTHFNHDPEPGDGLDFVDGIVMPRNTPGHGGFIKPEFYPR